MFLAICFFVFFRPRQRDYSHKRHIRIQNKYALPLKCTVKIYIFKDGAERWFSSAALSGAAGACRVIRRIRGKDEDDMTVGENAQFVCAVCVFMRFQDVYLLWRFILLQSCSLSHTLRVAWWDTRPTVIFVTPYRDRDKTCDVLKSYWWTPAVVEYWYYVYTAWIKVKKKIPLFKMSLSHLQFWLQYTMLWPVHGWKWFLIPQSTVWVLKYVVT